MKSKKKYTITDVADMLGVSRATVSRALNGTSGVGPELREKIIAFAEEIGYRPNTLARSLSKGRVNIIGLIFGDVRNPFYSELTFYIQKALERYGYTVMIFNSEYDREREARSIETARELCLAGLILFTDCSIYCGDKYGRRTASGDEYSNCLCQSNAGIAEL